MEPVDPRLAVAERLRAVADRLASVPPDEVATLDAAARRLDAVAADLGETAATTSFARTWAVGADGGPVPRHPLGTGACGVFPPFTWEERPGGLAAEVCFGPAFEGPPGTVHGGFVAAAFDIVVSAAATAGLGHAVTRTLALRYLRPSPLDEALRFEVEVGERAGRLAEVRAKLRVVADGRLTAKATAQFASVPRARFGRAGGEGHGRGEVD